MRASGRLLASGRLADGLTLGLLAALALAVTWNAFHYPSIAGYDAESHIDYARILTTEWRIPSELRNYYTPPGFFLPAGLLWKLGVRLELSDSGHLVQLFDGALAFGTALLLVALARIVFPGRAWLRTAALAFFVSCPIVLKTAAMFHPQNLVAFLAALALVLCARALRDGRFGLGSALLLGGVVGVGQLVRSVGLWTLGVICLALLAAAISRPQDRARLLQMLAVVAALGVLIPLPWYVYLQTHYDNPVFGRSSISAPAVREALAPGRSAAPAAFRLAAASAVPARSLWFFVDPGLPEVVTSPHRGAVAPRFWPVLYTDMWGDYYGIWSWGYPGKPTAAANEGRLELQALAGVAPTALAAVGVIALAGLALVRRRTAPELVLVPLMAAVALAGSLYYARSFGTSDGDTVKALYLLPAIPSLALCFGFATETLAARARWVAIVLGLVLSLALLSSLVYGIV